MNQGSFGAFLSCSEDLGELPHFEASPSSTDTWPTPWSRLPLSPLPHLTREAPYLGKVSIWTPGNGVINLPGAWFLGWEQKTAARV